MENTMVQIIRQRATEVQIRQMLNTLESRIKVAVDIRREILAGGGYLHSDCESALIEDGSKQEDIWGANWIADSKEIQFEALINIRPKQNNRSMQIQDEAIQTKVESIIRKLL